MTDPYRALYLHIPFCAKRCFYCDFATEATAIDDPRLDRYVERLTGEIRAASRDGLLGSIETIFIGGGTPSFLGPRRLVSLVYTLSVSINLHDDTEFTVEANPESLTTALVRDLYALGVNRFSLGVQSFDNAELATLGRIHTARRAREAIKLVHERCKNVSIDLMCGIPGQTPASWQSSVRQALELGVEHVSIYPLTIEDGTAFARAVEAGTQEPPDEDEQADMMEDAAALLEAAGFERYEVASYAQRGFACRHNSAYWTGVPYLGLGKGAAGMRNCADGSRQRLQDGVVIERLTPAQAAVEDIMLGMRLSCGVAQKRVEQAATLAPRLPSVIAAAEEAGLILYAQGRYRPTARGWLLGNELYRRIWDCAG
ncbi:MAG: radical SAM family heme chaperone HemW [Coriobacteriales bacterium]|jgi:oxygen-independent coproporphyrinogen-3 oxidase|nr:radical SAM family heme chaperone HemW [Coriobacteriales bacterium]